MRSAALAQPVAPPPSPAAAPRGDMGVAWSTYLRAGPAETATVLSELEHDRRVRVIGCDARWCHVSSPDADGYIDRDALDLPRTVLATPPASTGCVMAGLTDNRKPMPTPFCSGAAGGR